MAQPIADDNGLEKVDKVNSCGTVGRHTKETYFEKGVSDRTITAYLTLAATDSLRLSEGGDDELYDIGNADRRGDVGAGYER